LKARGKRAAAALLALALLCLCACGGNAPEPAPAEMPAPEPESTPDPTPCAHPRYVDGVCTVCGNACPHDWAGGICKLCGNVCPHPEHDERTHLCACCGEYAAHRYRDGRCLRCGAVPPFCTGTLPEAYFAPSPEQGSIETIDFRSAEDPADKKARKKAALVYLPCGYDAADGERRYNVVIALHGAGGDEHGMMDKVHIPNGGDGTCFRLIYDRMLYEKLCEPFILVSVNVYSLVEENSFTGYGEKNLAGRLRTLILPYVAGHYNTYAADPSEEAIRAARAHFGLIGLSNGALYALSAGFADIFELFGTYACFSGNYPETAEAVIARLGAPDAAELPVYCFITGAGTTDFQRENTEKRFDLIADACGGIVRGENAFHVDVEGTHNWKTWGTESYNALLVMFQNWN
jgi:enterochelin esterase-like enzyme